MLSKKYGPANILKYEESKQVFKPFTKEPIGDSIDLYGIDAAKKELVYVYAVVMMDSAKTAVISTICGYEFHNKTLVRASIWKLEELHTINRKVLYFTQEKSNELKSVHSTSARETINERKNFLENSSIFHYIADTSIFSTLVHFSRPGNCINNNLINKLKTNSLCNSLFTISL